MNKKLSTAELVIVVSGAVALVFSFFAWYKSGPISVNAWDSGLFPVATYAPVLCALMAIHIAATRLGNVTVPGQVGGFTWPQIHLVLGAVATLLMVGYLILDILGSPSKSVGFWLDLLAAIGALAGAVMLSQEQDRRA